MIEYIFISTFLVAKIIFPSPFPSSPFSSPPLFIPPLLSHSLLCFLPLRPFPTPPLLSALHLLSLLLPSLLPLPPSPQIIAAQEEMLRKERELEEARKKLAQIRQQQYKFLPTELREDES